MRQKFKSLSPIHLSNRSSQAQPHDVCEAFESWAAQFVLYPAFLDFGLGFGEVGMTAMNPRCWVGLKEVWWCEARSYWPCCALRRKIASSIRNCVMPASSGLNISGTILFTFKISPTIAYEENDILRRYILKVDMTPMRVCSWTNIWRDA